MADGGGTAGLARRTRRRRPGLFDLYLLRGVAGPFLLILPAVLVAMMLERALRLIHELAASGADISYFLPLLAQLLPYYLDLAIPASFMVALILLVARLDDRLELEAMMASGLSLSRIAAPLVGLGLLLGLAGLAAGGWLEPLGRYGFRAMRIEALNAGRIGRLEPGAIYHPSDSLAVTFDRRDPDGGVTGVFVWQRLPDGRRLTLTGSRGRIGFAPGDRLFGIDLAAGRYFAEPTSQAAGSPELVTFRSFAFRELVRLTDPSWRRGWDQKELTLPELAAAIRERRRDIPARALETEYYSRIVRAATIPLLPLLALPLAFATKRGRRGYGILLCGLLLAAIHHGTHFAEKLGLSGAMDPRASNLGALAICATLALLIFLSGRRLPSHSPIQRLLQPIGARSTSHRAPERIRPSPSGRTVAAYLVRRLGAWTLMALLAVVALQQMVDLFERGAQFVERGLGLADVGYYVLLRLPAMLQQSAPIAALAGAMITFAAIGRSLEMTAIRAAGISQWRILIMVLPVPVLLALSIAALGEYATPRSQHEFADWWASTERSAPAAAPRGRWFRIREEIVRADAASSDGTRLSRVEIFRRDGEGQLESMVSARNATAGSRGWTLSNATVTRLSPQGIAREAVAGLAWPARMQPGDVAAFFSPTAAMSAAAARRSLSEDAPVSRSGSLFATRIHRSFAEPLAPFLMLLFALPLAFVPPRGRGAWPAMLFAGGAGLLYLVADGVLTVASQVGYLPVMVGAWAAPVIGALTGVIVLLYSER